MCIVKGIHPWFLKSFPQNPEKSLLFCPLVTLCGPVFLQCLSSGPKSPTFLRWCSHPSIKLGRTWLFCCCCCGGLILVLFCFLVFFLRHGLLHSAGWSGIHCVAQAGLISEISHVQFRMLFSLNPLRGLL